MFSQVPLIRRTLSLVWFASGKWTVAWGSVVLLLGVLPALIVYLSKWLVDALATGIGHGASFEQSLQIAFPAGALAVAVLASRVLAGLSDWVNLAQTQLVQDHIKHLIHQKAANVDYSFFESPDYFDDFHQANSQASMRTLSLLKNLSSTTQSVITFLSISALLCRYSLWLPILLLFSAVPAFIVLLKYNRSYHTWWKSVTADRRWAMYLDTVLTSQYSAAEVRINDLGAYLSAKHREIRSRIRIGELKWTSRKAFTKIAASLMTLLVVAFAMAWIVYRALVGTASLGDLALFYQSFTQGQSSASSLLSSFSDIHSNTLFLKQVFEYLDRPNLMAEPQLPSKFPTKLQAGIEFRDVSFTYPGRNAPALSHFDLIIPAGKIVAVVGENGAGKSTLLKLLCRLYDPDEGQVTLDNIDLRSFTLKDLRRQIAVMFQNPVKYHLTAAQNIEIGDLEGQWTSRDIQWAAESAGAHEFIERLPSGYETLLGRSFDEAAELSGGEWQRLALARAFLRQAQILILDEPTSFMDSWAEAEWLERFRTLVNERSAIIVTHRFTTAMQADLIYVMQHGGIVESGTHAELLDLGGMYASSWFQQQHQQTIRKN